MTKTIAIIFFSLVLCSCERDNGNFCQQLDYDSSGYLPFSTIDTFSNDSLNIWLDITDTVLWYKYEKIFHVIKDQQTFENLVRSNRERIDFNFEDFTLLIGYVFVNSGPAEITEQRVSVRCNTYEQSVGYKVIIESEHLEHGLEAIQFHAIITKVPDDIPITCGISVHENISN